MSSTTKWPCWCFIFLLRYLAAVVRVAGVPSRRLLHSTGPRLAMTIWWCQLSNCQLLSQGLIGCCATYLGQSARPRYYCYLLPLRWLSHHCCENTFYNVILSVTLTTSSLCIVNVILPQATQDINLRAVISWHCVSDHFMLYILWHPSKDRNNSICYFSYSNPSQGWIR